MILVYGGLADRVTELVCARLLACGYEFHLVDTAVYPTGYDLAWRWRGSIPEGYIAGDGWRVELDELTGVYARYAGPEARIQPEDIAPDLTPSLYAERDTGLAALFEDLPCTVVNRMAGGVSNHSKPLQGLHVRACGLLTPPTLVTSDPDAAREFYDRHGQEVIYKSLSGIRSIVRRLSDEQLARLPLLRHGPSQFQAFIPGDDVRVHTVGDQLFATRVVSEAVDYRYARREGKQVAMEPANLPPHVVRGCLELARRMDLLLAGIDLRETPDGEYYCFEVNPSPGFLYYEQATGQPISAALADLLHADPARNSTPGTREVLDGRNEVTAGSP